MDIPTEVVGEVAEYAAQVDALCEALSKEYGKCINWRPVDLRNIAPEENYGEWVFLVVEEEDMHPENQDVLAEIPVRRVA